MLRVRCPHCETIFTYYESNFRPFCSERCKLIDLGHWFEESYRVPDKGQKNQDQINSNNNEYEENEEGPENYEQTYDEEDFNESDYE
jgi:endogenous inhibitor of DNA gyrase (YacG/DUF329 family)